MPLSKSLAELLGIMLLSDVDVCVNSPYLFKEEEKDSIKASALEKQKIKGLVISQKAYSGLKAALDRSVKNSFDRPP